MEHMPHITITVSTWFMSAVLRFGCTSWSSHWKKSHWFHQSEVRSETLLTCPGLEFSSEEVLCFAKYHSLCWEPEKPKSDTRLHTCINMSIAWKPLVTMWLCWLKYLLCPHCRRITTHRSIFSETLCKDKYMSGLSTPSQKPQILGSIQGDVPVLALQLSFWHLQLAQGWDYPTP